MVDCIILTIHKTERIIRMHLSVSVLGQPKFAPKSLIILGSFHQSVIRISAVTYETLNLLNKQCETIKKNLLLLRILKKTVKLTRVLRNNGGQLNKAKILKFRRNILYFVTV